MQDYKIKGVKSTPKEWESSYGKFKTWLIQVEGNGEPIQLNKKADSPMPKEGDELYGEIEQTEYGQKFKSAKKPFTPGGYRGKSPEEQTAIQKMNALTNAVNHVTPLASVGETVDVLEQAQIFYDWLRGEPKVED